MFDRIAATFFGGLLYSETWEDYHTDRAAANFQEGDLVLGITSGGGFPLNCSLEPVAHITAVDRNPIQNYWLEFKIQSIRCLDFEEFWQLLTQKNKANAAIYHRKLKTHLPAKIREYFQRNQGFIKNGLLNNGMLCVGLNLFRRYFRFLFGQKFIEKLIQNQDLEIQQKIFQRDVFPALWKRWFHGFPIEGLILFGVPPVQTRYLRKHEIFSIGAMYEKRLAALFSRQLLARNFFWKYILTGKWCRETAPPYLQEENFQRLKQSIAKIKIVTGNLLDFLEHTEETFAVINISDVPEWLEPGNRLEQVFERITWKSVLIMRTAHHRFIPALGNFKLDRPLSEELSARERTGSYNLFQVFKNQL